ncbi:MAG: hypothetical protein R3335_03815 [Anaerolineales bacterium]|nr:hypothetical protein [Anaerolineales bacterium]
MTSNADKTEGSDPWAHFRYFLGSWRGRGDGKPGLSRIERSYRLVLNNRFIQINDRAVYEPQEANPEGEIHEEIGFLSFDESRQTHVLREFHVEGFVNRYVLETCDAEAGQLVFVTEAIENIAPGWSARTTYDILSPDRFRETFDLAGPEKPWACYMTNEFKRVEVGET